MCCTMYTLSDAPDAGDDLLVVGEVVAPVGDVEDEEGDRREGARGLLQESCLLGAAQLLTHGPGPPL